jgi:flagellar biosynthesis/type III secretory pathway chaperone
MKIKILTDTLSIQLNLLEELLALLERETPELAGISLDAMAEINGLKEELTARIDEHTAPLRQTITEVAVSLGLPSNAALGEVAALLGKQGNKEIPRLHQDLKRMAEKVRQVATLNRDIAERFVSTVSNSLNFLAHILNQSPVYGASGGYQRRQAGAVMINREA